MANSDSPRGLVPIKQPQLHGVEYLKVTSTYTADIGVGTPLVEVAAGFVQAVSSATAANQAFVGVAMEFRDGSVGKTNKIAVNTNPFQKFLAQSAITTNTQAVVGASVGFSTPAGVNTTTQLSKCEIAGAGTTSAAPLRIVGIHEREGGGNEWGANVDLIVQPIFGLHQRAGDAGV